MDADGDVFSFKGPAFFDPNFVSPLPPASMQQHREDVFSLPQALQHARKRGRICTRAGLG
jgi:hypothetical protein